MMDIKTEQNMIRREKITKAVAEFAKEMTERMLAKDDEGLYGWDDEDNIEEFAQKIAVAVIFKKYIDVANFAMFLHRFDKNKK